MCARATSFRTLPELGLIRAVARSVRAWSSLGVAAVLCVACGGGEDRPVTVQVYAEGRVASVGTPVAFHRGDGSTLSVVMTDASGRAVGTVEPGGAVTALFRQQGPTQYASALGLQGGEALVLGSLVPAPDLQAEYGSVRVRPPETTPESDWVASDAGCGSNGHQTAGDAGAIRIFLGAECSFPFINVLTTAASRLDTGSRISHYAYTTDVMLTLDTRVVQGEWRQDFDFTDLTLTNLPEGLEWLMLKSEERRGESRFSTGSLEIPPVESASMVGVRLPWTRGFATGTTLVVEAGGGVNRYATPVAPTARTVDLIADFLPVITAIPSETGGFALTRSAPAMPADAMFVEVEWFSETRAFHWYITAPPDLDSVQFPTLPPEFGESAPAVVAPFSVYGLLVASSGWESYQDVLATEIDVPRSWLLRDTFDEGLFQTSSFKLADR